jgi:hypothetical protein
MENILEKKEKDWEIKKKKYLSDIDYQYDQAKKFLVNFEQSLSKKKFDTVAASISEAVGHLNKIKDASEEIMDGEKKLKMEKEDVESEQEWEQGHQASRNLVRKVLKAL